MIWGYKEEFIKIYWSIFLMIDVFKTKAKKRQEEETWLEKRGLPVFFEQGKQVNMKINIWLQLSHL